MTPLRERRKAIRERWIHEVLATYPEDRGRFLHRERDRFANPVGASIQAGADALIAVLVGESTPEDVRSALDTLVRIRSVQEFTVGEAMAPLFMLKRVVREELGEGMEAFGLERWLVVEERVDALVLEAFDIFVGCRQSMYEIRAKASEKRNAVLLRRAAKALGLEEEAEAEEDPEAEDGPESLE